MGLSTPTVGAACSALSVEETGFTITGFVGFTDCVECTGFVAFTNSVGFSGSVGFTGFVGSGRVVVERVWVAGSAGVSMPLAPESSCSPIGFRGSRRVPLLGTGVIPTESHNMLYTSIFSAVG